MNNRRISLASGVLPEFDPIVVARAAVAAGYSDAGLMIRPDEWQLDWEDELLMIKENNGLGFLDVEVLWIPTGGALDESHFNIVDIGGRLGADHLLVVSDEADPDLLSPALIELSQRCAGCRIKPMLEFLRITPVESLSQAKELLSAAQDCNFGILLDSLHLARSGELQNLPDLDPAMHPYIQLCDGFTECAEDRASLLRDAVDLRTAPGAGELNLRGLLDALPGHTPLSLEVRSEFYREQYSDPTDRALAVLTRTLTFLEEIDHV